MSEITPRQSLVVKLLTIICFSSVSLISQVTAHEHLSSQADKTKSSRTLAHYLGNEGVMVSGDKVKVLFDPFFHNHYDSFTLVPETIRQRIFSNQAPYNDIDAIFVSHIHGDHFDAGDTVKYLLNHKKVRLFVPAQGIDKLEAIEGFSQVSTQIEAVELNYNDKPVKIDMKEFQVEAVFIPHSGWPNTKDVQNIVYRVKANNEFTVMHFGDADSNPDFYTRYSGYWQSEKTQLSFIPFWLGLKAEGKKVINEIINTDKSIGVHVPAKGHPALPDSGLDYFSKPGETREVTVGKEQAGEKGRAISDR
ncbi:MBL fold metallo-hydrolase [Aliikangiella sp. G2MR2-5]|uniref:MBL fold metallo-hydrolase n=1 Tax=Aliikangiella sp. G2MR2-5 TaxID=2788943 RepID=UPI0018A9EB46|nr:MBL fold metallo-hydrolase [Aliikangiella sp. G2MR2-5]